MDPKVSERKELLKSALIRIEQLEKRLAAAEQRPREAVAVVGVGCRFPGGANDPDAFWKLLRDGSDAIVDIPSMRWKLDDYFDSDPDAPGKMYARGGGFVDDVDLFDPKFFGIAPREAPQMDPQHRLLLETAWVTLEHAGIAPGSLTGSQTGVFIGLTTHDYARMQANRGGLEFIDTYFGTGVAGSVAAGRLSYILGLRGPAVTLDTACSSSLVAIHLACQSLRNNETRLALAGGVNLILWPEGHVIASKGRMLAPDSRCKTFDARANGYVRSEGCGLVALKRLSDAIADGDPVLAVIRGTAINQDGRSSGLTAPNGRAQEEVMRQALADAGIAPSDVAYVETHGTGTSLGDPIEVQALGAVQGVGRPADRPLLIGSVKTNIGHLEAAAGVAGLIKAVLALHHEELPPHLHFETPNPLIPWRDMSIEVASARRRWPENRPRVIGVSSFGFSGTNAHIVLEAPPPLASRTANLRRPVELLVLSGRTPGALEASAARAEQALRECPPDRLGDLCFTAAAGRSHFEYRLATVAGSASEMIDALRAFQEGRSAKGLIHGEASLKRLPEVAFVFTGQGSQYVNMGRALYETEASFRATIDRCDAILQPKLGRSLVSVLYPPAGHEAEGDALLSQTAWTQPALFAIEYALAELWQSWGIQPAVVLGHSVGEYVAACVAGVFSLEDGLALICERARLMQELPAGGAMVAIPLNETAVARAAERFSAQVSIAAVNAPSQTVLSGAADAVNSVVEALGGPKLKAQRLTVSHAFHSPLIEPMLEAFGRFASRISYHPPRIPIVSNVTGSLVEAPATLDAAYWQRHARAAVRFADSLETVRRTGSDVMLEVGPNPTLTALAARGEHARGTTWIASLRKGQDDWRQMTTSLGAMYVAGVQIDWPGYERNAAPRKVHIPTYPFQRERYWVAAPPPRSGAAQREFVHPLLGARVTSPRLADLVFERELDASALEWIGEHRIFDRVVVPAAAYLEAAMAAARFAFGERGASVGTLTIHEPLVLDDTRRVVQTVVIRRDSDTEVQIHSRAAASDGGAEDWTLHAAGRLNGRDIAAPSTTVLRPDAAETLTPADYYARLHAAGVDYGPSFRGLAAIARGDHAASATIAIPETVEPQLSAYHLHPSLLDACFQLLGVALPAIDGSDDVYLPVEVGEYRLFGVAAAHMRCVARVEPARETSETFVGEVTLESSGGAPIAQITGLRFKRASVAALRRSAGASLHDWFYELQWRELAPVAVPDSSAGHWVLFADTSGCAPRIAEEIHARGGTCIVVARGDAYQPPESGRAIVRPDEPQDFVRLLGDLSKEPLRGVVHLWTLDAPEPVDADALASARTLGPISVLHLAQALGSTSAALPLTVVTRGAQRASDDQAGVGLAQAPVWGLARVIANEHPALGCRIVDLDPSRDADADSSLLAAEIVDGDRRESQIALRAGRRLGARLAKAARKAAGTLPVIRDDAWYVVTGGSGGLGLVMARWLVARGARHLALLARRTPSGEAAAALREIEQLGAEIATVSVDVADFDALRQVFDTLERSRGVAGIIHAAGVIDDALLGEQNAERLTRVMRPKVDGSWNVHRLTRDRSLDFFALFSAGAALFGAPGQANYAAANAFLDALAWHRQAAGLSAMSVNWGPWEGAGMAAALDGSRRDRWAAQGIGTIEPARGTEAFELALQEGHTQLAIMPLDWPRFVAQWPDGTEPPLIRDLAGSSRSRAQGAARQPPDAGFLKRLETAMPEERIELLLALVREQVATVIGLPADETLRNDRGFAELGMDSLMSVELSNRLKRTLHVSLPATLAFEFPNIELLTAHLTRDILHLETGEEAAPRPLADQAADASRKLLEEVGELTDDEAAASLAAELERAGY